MTTVTIIGLGPEVLIFVGMVFYLLYLANSYENQWIKLALKLFSTIMAVATAYLPLINVSLANKEAMYDSWAFMYMWGFILFWFVWFVIFLWEMFNLFLKKDKDSLEETQ